MKMAAHRILLASWLYVLCSVVATPCPEETRVYKKEHCIPITPQREAEIQEIIDKISNYVDNLTLEHKYFDIRLMKFAIERHMHNETEDKPVEIQVTINDCPDTYEFEADSDTSDVNPINSDVNSDAGSAKPEVLRLELDDNGQDVVRFMQKAKGKKPIVVYTQVSSGENQYLFMRR